MTDRLAAGLLPAAEAQLVLTLQGNNIRDITSFYDEINRVFMVGVDWRLGESLDALNDLLYGGYGVLLDCASAQVIWLDHRIAREALGTEATRQWLQHKLDRPEAFATAGITTQLSTLEAGTGRTYFDLVLDVFADHPAITLALR
ncbi:ribonuclease inhibitor [Nakamurella sp. A5-74]|uniref:Ribonuclease inhibitor n=1 Tax=Nakamurella sp. A5-74 TaxID=3158264 RepID=A0AAU8DTV7_9ACTN